MKPGVTCQKLVSLTKISPVTEKTSLFHILSYLFNKYYIQIHTYVHIMYTFCALIMS